MLHLVLKRYERFEKISSENTLNSLRRRIKDQKWLYFNHSVENDYFERNKIGQTIYIQSNADKSKRKIETEERMRGEASNHFQSY